MTAAESVNEEAVEAAARAIFDEEGPGCIDYDGAYANARTALAAALPLLRLSDVPHLERQIRDDERAKVLAEAFEAISARLGMAGDQTARMIALAALRSVSS